MKQILSWLDYEKIESLGAQVKVQAAQMNSVRVPRKSNNIFVFQVFKVYKEILCKSDHDI